MRSLALISSQAFSLVNFRGPLIAALAGRGVHVYALAPDYNAAYMHQVESLGAEPIPYSLSRAGLNPLKDISDAVRLMLLLHKLKPDISLSYFIKPVIFGSLASRVAGVKSCYSIIEGLGYVFVDDKGNKTFKASSLRKLVSCAYRAALRMNKNVFFLNDEDIAEFKRLRIVSPEQVIRLDGIGVDLNRFQFATPVKSPVVFLFMARMLKDKGVFEFVEAAKIVRATHPRGVRFLLLGGTDANPASVSEPTLKTLAEEGIVEWVGNKDDVRPWIAQSSVFVLPSYREGLPRSTQEAMAMGRPVITTDSVGCRDTVEEGLNGFLVPVRDAPAIARAMMRFIETPELIEKMGFESRRLAEQRFDVHRINEKVMKALGI